MTTKCVTRKPNEDNNNGTITAPVSMIEILTLRRFSLHLLFYFLLSARKNCVQKQNKNTN
jgi:hypothetical protein